RISLGVSKTIFSYHQDRTHRASTRIATGTTRRTARPGQHYRHYCIAAVERTVSPANSPPGHLKIFLAPGPRELVAVPFDIQQESVPVSSVNTLHAWYGGQHRLDAGAERFNAGIKHPR